jgi:SnoaL-like polyketide cyclase
MTPQCFAVRLKADERKQRRRFVVNIKIGSTMAPRDIASIVRVVIDEIWNQGTLDLADGLFAHDYVNHGGLIPDLTRGPEAIKISVLLYRLAFPGMHVVEEDLLIVEDMAVLHWAAYGAHATKKSAKEALLGVTICRFAGRQIAESWTYWDAGSVACRLGLIPLVSEREGEVRSRNSTRGFAA